jgi:HrpA-like RNA helicase
MAISVFDLMPEIGRMLISGYNHKCRDDVVNLAAIFEVAEYRLDNIFENFRPSSKNNAIKKVEKQHYDKTISKWANSMGDHFSLLDIYNQFCQYKYNQIDRRTGSIIKNKKGDAKQWCKQHFLRHDLLERVREQARQINQKFGKVISIYRESNPTAKLDYIFLTVPPTISDKKNENILKAIFDGFYINLMKKTGSKYTNCFPHVKTTGILSRESLFSKIKSPTKYAIYTQLRSIFGKTNYAIIAKVSPSLIEKLMKSPEGKCVEYCFKKMNEEVIKNNKKSHKWFQHKKKFHKFHKK